MFAAAHRPSSIMVFLSVIAVLTVMGCSPDPSTDGRFWRQPPEHKPALRTMAATVGIHGDTAQSGIGHGFTITGEWAENGGAFVGRTGLAAQSSRYSGTGATVGDAGLAAQSRVWTESIRDPGVSGRTMRSGSYGETSTRTGVTP
jgi:hypothetical protein